MTTERVYGRSRAGGERNPHDGWRAHSNCSSENRQSADSRTALANDNEASLSERLPSDVEDRWPRRPRGCEDRPEVGVSRDQCPVFGAGSVQHRLVVRAVETEIRGVHGVMAMLDKYGCQARRQLLVHQELHAGRVNGNSRSRTASAAQRSDSATSSASKYGRSSRISWTDMPSATMATTVATGTRIPRIHGAPPMTRGSTVMRVNVIAQGYATGAAARHLEAPLPFEGCALTALEVQRLRGGFSFRISGSSRSKARRSMAEPYQGCVLPD